MFLSFRLPRPNCIALNTPARFQVSRSAGTGPVGAGAAAGAATGGDEAGAGGGGAAVELGCAVAKVEIDAAASFLLRVAHLAAMGHLDFVKLGLGRSSLIVKANVHDLDSPKLLSSLPFVRSVPPSSVTVTAVPGPRSL